jgi:cobalamin biosynthesis protein CobT
MVGVSSTQHDDDDKKVDQGREGMVGVSSTQHDDDDKKVDQGREGMVGVSSTQHDDDDKNVDQGREGMVETKVIQHLTNKTKRKKSETYFASNNIHKTVTARTYYCRRAPLESVLRVEGPKSLP